MFSMERLGCWWNPMTWKVCNGPFFICGATLTKLSVWVKPRDESSKKITLSTIWRGVSTTSRYKSLGGTLDNRKSQRLLALILIGALLLRILPELYIGDQVIELARLMDHISYDNL